MEPQLKERENDIIPLASKLFYVSILSFSLQNNLCSIFVLYNLPTIFYMYTK